MVRKQEARQNLARRKELNKLYSSGKLFTTIGGKPTNVRGLTNDKDKLKEAE